MPVFTRNVSNGGENMPRRTVWNWRNIGLVVAGVFGFITLMGSYTVINPGYRGVLVTMGKTSNDVLQEGLHLKLPFIQSIRKIPVQVQKSESGSEAATKDLQRVHAKLALNWNLDPTKVNELFRTVGDEEAVYERIIIPAVSETLKSATAKMTAEEVLTKRMLLKEDIDTILAKRLSAYNITVRDVSIVDLDFTAEFNKAVEEKQVAEQHAKRADYTAQQAIAESHARVNTAEGDAKARLINAKAQAESQRLLRETITPQLLQLKAIEKWNGEFPHVMGSNGNMLFNIPTQNK